MKKLLLFLLAISINQSLTYAQEVKWLKSYGGYGSDFLYSVEQTADGGFILGGMSESNISGDKLENSNGGWDIWIVKTDVSGTIQWQNTIGGSDYDEITSVQQTPDGGYIIGGSSDSYTSGDKTEDNSGLTDIWVIKLDNSGNIVWQNTIGGNQTDKLNAIVQTADGGYVLGGYSDSNISGDKTENCYGLFDYWILKIDSTGNVQWQKTFGGGNYDFLQSVKLTADGGFLLGGYSYSNISGVKSENSNGSSDYWIIKTDSSGTIQWQNTIGGNSSDELFASQQTSDGGYVMGGRSLSNATGDKTENCIGSSDYWIVKTDGSGNIIWQNTIGGSGDDAFYCLKQTSDDGFIIGGFSDSGISGDKTESNFTAHDFWVVKTDAVGAIQWQNNIGGGGNEVLVNIMETNDGDYMLAGFSNSTVSGEITDSNNGADDFCLIRLTEKYNFITGNMFADLNNNNTFDSGEPEIPNRKVTEQNTSRFSIGNQNGFYSLSVLDSGNFNVVPVTLNNYSFAPASQNSYFSGFQQTDSQNNFAYQPQGVLNDFNVTITPLGPFRSGFVGSYMINYENVGTTNITPTIIFYMDNNLSFSFANVTPSNITTNSLVWNPGSMAPFESGSIIVAVNVASALAIGTPLNASVKVEPVAGDANPADNESDWEVLVSGSYDPNDILVSDKTITTTQLATGPFLDYIIRFQNTGNDTAFTVNILNLIKTDKLNLNTFELVSASHNVEINWRPWERNMEFTFNNIMLPDSAINEPLSHGFVRYRIKPKSNLTSGSVIPNNAAIYFDFNDPVLTNTAMTTIVLPTGMQSTGETFDYMIYPNPAIGESFIELTAAKSAIAQLNLLTIEGKLISNENHNLKPGPNKLNLNTTELSSGIYLVRMVIDGNTVVKKLVKM
jgi:hypothetical protein